MIRRMVRIWSRARGGAISAAAAAEGAGTASPGVMVARPSLAKLLASHILRDGEVVLLILRPSLWFILVSGIRFLAATVTLMIIARVVGGQNHHSVRIYMELGAAALAGRVMWAILQWMGRLYILTDLRVLCISGVFQLDVFDCPLRKIARTRILRGPLDRALLIGSVEIIPMEPAHPIGMWLTIDRPIEVNEQIVATIHRAKGNHE